MHAIAAFFILLFSMSHAASIRHSLTVEPDTRAIETSQLAPSRAEITQIRSGSVYAGTGCLSCQRTNITYIAH